MKKKNPKYYIDEILHLVQRQECDIIVISRHKIVKEYFDYKFQRKQINYKHTKQNAIDYYNFGNGAKVTYMTSCFESMLRSHRFDFMVVDEEFYNKNSLELILITNKIAKIRIEKFRLSKADIANMENKNND